MTECENKTDPRWELHLGWVLGWPMKRELSLTQNGTEKEGQKSQCISSHNPCSYFKPHSPYPVFLFLFKFFFKFPNFPLEALDVLGELGNGLGLLATTTAAP